MNKERGNPFSDKELEEMVAEELAKYHAKPEILITGQHHSRELITSSMALYSVLKMIHGSLVHNMDKYRGLLTQNKYFVIPTVNVDGLAFIEDTYLSTGQIPQKRTNAHIYNSKCDKVEGGVDLNRNYAYGFA